MPSGSVGLALVPTKMSPPRERLEHIRRPELERKLREAPDARLLLVSAPAGYGKTTLVAQWVRTGGRPAAWVSLDEGDRSARRFWSYVLAAIGRIVPEAVREAGASFASFAPLEDVVIPSLLSGVAAAPEGLLLVLDDFHEASSAAVDASLSAAVEGAPDGLQVVASTRHDPALPLPRWRARGWLAEVRQLDLRMTEEEAGAWFRDRMGLQASAEVIAGLMDLTGGWPAGLYLASIALRGSPDLEAASRRLVDDPRILHGYAIDEIVAAWPADVRALMRRVSVLDRFSESLLDEVLVPPPMPGDVRELERRNLMVDALEPDHAWYRIHPLLSEVLRLELRATEPAAGPEILRRASRWHMGRGESELAISYAIGSGDWTLAGELINASWLSFALAGQDDALRQLIEGLPDGVADGDPRILVTRAWIAVRQGEWAVAERSLDTAVALDPAASLPDGTRSVQVAAAIIRGGHPYAGTATMRENGQLLLELLPPEDPLRFHAGIALGLADYLDGDPDRARVHLERVQGLVNPPALRVAVVAELAMLAADEGDLEAAERCMALAWEIAQEHDLGNDWLSSQIHTAQGALLSATGRLREAIPHYERGAASLGAPFSIDRLEAITRLLRARREAGQLDPEDPLISEARAICASWGSAGDRYLDRIPGHQRQPIEGPSGVQLTPAEERVFEILTTTHLTQPEIAASMHLSSNTVKTHVRSIYAKLGVRTREEARRFASAGNPPGGSPGVESPLPGEGAVEG